MPLKCHKLKLALNQLKCVLKAMMKVPQEASHYYQLKRVLVGDAVLKGFDFKIKFKEQ